MPMAQCLGWRRGVPWRNSFPGRFCAGMAYGRVPPGAGVEAVGMRKNLPVWRNLGKGRVESMGGWLTHIPGRNGHGV